MAHVYISAAFSLQMLATDASHDIHVYPMTIGQVREIYRRGIYRDHVPVVSAVGHADTARVVSEMLGFEVPAQRISVELEPGDLLVVAQLIGGRLPEGATTLPEGFQIRFMGVKVES